MWPRWEQGGWAVEIGCSMIWWWMKGPTWLASPYLIGHRERSSSATSKQKCGSGYCHLGILVSFEALLHYEIMWSWIAGSAGSAAYLPSSLKCSSIPTQAIELCSNLAVEFHRFKVLQSAFGLKISGGLGVHGHYGNHGLVQVPHS